MRASLPVMSSRSHSTRARFFLPMMVLAFALLAAGPAMAVKPYRDPIFRQPKATLKQGYSIQRDAKHEYHPKVGKSYAISHNGLAPQFHRHQFSYSSSRSRPRR
jgi:hypothetical protein